MSVDALVALRRIIDRQSPPRRRINVILLFNAQQIQTVTGKNAVCLSLTSRHACIWYEQGTMNCLLNSSKVEESPSSSNRPRRRSSTSSSSYMADYQEHAIDSEWPISLADWIHNKLNQSVQQLIGVDFRWIPHTLCKQLQDQLDRLGEHRLVNACQMLERVCQLRCQPNNCDIAVFPVTGFIAYAQKVKSRIMRCWPCDHLKDIEWLVITSKDEICWLFDFKDITSANMPSVILGPCPKLFIDQKPNKILVDCFAKETGGLMIRPSSEALGWMADLCGKVAMTGQASESIHRALQSAKCVIINYSPVAQGMSRRNQIERECIQELFERDSAAICCFLYKLHGQLNRPCSKLLSDERCRFDDFISDQSTISQLSGKNMVLMRTKSKYSQGVCLTTRLITNVLVQDSITYTISVRAFLRLINTPFPAGKTTGSQLDAIAVRHLYWLEGIEPPLETGKAIGLHAMLDSPVIGSNAYDHIIEVGNVLKFYCGTNESIATENCVIVVNADEIPTTINPEDGSQEDDNNCRTRLLSTVSTTEWLQCRPLTLVPFDSNTLDIKQFDPQELTFLNEYNSLCYEILYEQLQAISDSDTCIWLKSLARPIVRSRSIINTKYPVYML
ncbi:hypothetical protein GJ496_005232 [Pomphorhynchus laevis]|nr:hypothetical protein GJ496_005232 [Pomphorhynchus laevis]